MNTQFQIDERVIQRAMEPYPKIPEIVPFSTPVVSFGDPNEASMVTVGINPSSLEFFKGSKVKKLLAPGEKRLVDTETLGIELGTTLNRDQAIRVIVGCYNYFKTKPYDWFDHLEENANKVFGYSYKNGSSAHLDLVQWATDPVWGNFEDEITQEILLKNDLEFLKYQIALKKYEIVFLNGAKVHKHLTDHGLLEAATVEGVPYRTKNGDPRILKIYQGKTPKGSLVLGWNRPFPGHYISKEEFPRVMREVHNFFRKITR